MMWLLWLLALLVIVVWIGHQRQMEGFLIRLGWEVGFPQFNHDPNVVYTSGTDVLTPLPYWTAFGAPGYWPYSPPSMWTYDVPWYGAWNTPWVGPEPWVGGRKTYRPGHGPGYSGVAVGGGGGHN